MSNNNVSEYKGSKVNFQTCYSYIAERWGNKEAESYNPYENCFTLKKWNELGYRVIKGEHAIKCLNYIPITKINEKGEDEQVGVYPKTVNLFYILQVRKVEQKQPVSSEVKSSEVLNPVLEAITA